MKTIASSLIITGASILSLQGEAMIAHGFSLSMKSSTPSIDTLKNNHSNRRTFLSTATLTGASILATQTIVPSSANAAATAKEIFNTPSGIKYAILKEPSSKSSSTPYKGDIVAIEYTGYLSNGQIFDATHAEGKSNALLFKLGTGSVIPGLDEIVSVMTVGQKVQAIIPPQLAYADKGVCLEDGECLIKPGSTLVYDVYLKKSSIPPP